MAEIENRTDDISTIKRLRSKLQFEFQKDSSHHESFVDILTESIHQRNRNIDCIKEFMQSEESQEVDEIKKLLRLCEDMKEKPLKIALVGGENCGKSMLASLLVDKAIMLPSIEEQRTTKTTILTYADKVKFRNIDPRNGHVCDEYHMTSGFTTHMSQFIYGGASVNKDGKYLPYLMEIGVPTELLKCGLQIIDFPALNENVLQTQFCHFMLCQMKPQIICYVYNHWQGFSLTDAQCLYDLLLSYKDADYKSVVEIVLIANKIDGEMENDFDDSDDTVMSQTLDMEQAEKLAHLNWESVTRSTNTAGPISLHPCPLSTGALYCHSVEEESDPDYFKYLAFFEAFKSEVGSRIVKLSKNILNQFVNVMSKCMKNSESHYWLLLKSLSIDVEILKLINMESDSQLQYTNQIRVSHHKYREFVIQITSLSTSSQLPDEVSKEIIHLATQLTKVNPDKFLCHWSDDSLNLIELRSSGKRLLDHLEVLDLKKIESLIQSVAENTRIIEEIQQNFRADNMYLDKFNNIKKINIQIPNHKSLPFVLKSGQAVYPFHIHPSLVANDNVYRDGAQFIYSFGWFVWILLEGTGCPSIETICKDRDLWRQELAKGRFNSDYPEYLGRVISLCLSVQIGEENEKLQIMWFEICKILGVTWQLPYFLETGNFDMAKQIIENDGFDINKTDEFQKTCVMLATETDNVKSLKFLIQQGADINISTEDGVTAIYIAAAFDHNLCLEILLQQNNADIECSYKDGSTPLIMAAYFGCVTCLKILLQCKANINSVKKNGDNALITAAYNGHTECLNELLKYGANVDSVNKNGFTALYCATVNCHVMCVRGAL